MKDIAHVRAALENVAARWMVLAPLGSLPSTQVSLPTRNELAKMAGTMKNRFCDLMRAGVVKKASWSCRMFLGNDFSVTWDSSSGPTTGAVVCFGEAGVGGGGESGSVDCAQAYVASTQQSSAPAILDESRKTI